jgi:NADP-dependent 3-hydroxy acid dehydrogenase YdfG
MRESSMSGIKGKVIAMTGASSGIGEAAAARAIAFAVEQPADMDVSEIIVRPTASPY